MKIITYVVCGNGKQQKQWKLQQSNIRAGAKPQTAPAAYLLALHDFALASGGALNNATCRHEYVCVCACHVNLKLHNARACMYVKSEMKL